MESKVEKLKPARAKIWVQATAKDLAPTAEHILAHATESVAIKGFRPGKAPRPMLVQAVGKARLLSDLIDHVLPELLQQATQKAGLTVIEPPAYTVDKLCDLNPDGTLREGTVLEFTAEADYAPDVTVADYHKIKIKPAKVEEVTDKDVDEVLNQLADRRAEFVKVDRAAKKGDRVEIDFAGKRNGIPEERLASQHYPIVLGSDMMIPGFEDALVGKKAGDKFSFEITFPEDYHAKDLAKQKVVFDVTVHEVAEKKLPELNDAFAKHFGHKKLDELKDAIRKERALTFAQAAKEKDQEAVLEAFLPLVKAEIPKTLIEHELDRQMETMRQQVQQVGASFDAYLSHLKKTEEELREEMRPTAEKAVIIGLGLGEVVEKEGLPKDKNAGYTAIEKLVELATKPTKKSSSSV